MDIIDQNNKQDVCYIYNADRVFSRYQELADIIGYPYSTSYSNDKHLNLIKTKQEMQPVKVLLKTAHLKTKKPIYLIQNMITQETFLVGPQAIGRKE